MGEGMIGRGLPSALNDRINVSPQHLAGGTALLQAERSIDTLAAAPRNRAM